MLFPGHKYLGPGNQLENGEPVDSDDKIAQIHDKAYERAKTKEDIFSADQQAISSFWKNWKSEINVHSLVGAGRLGVKHLAEKHLFNRILYPSMPQEKKRINIISDTQIRPPNKKPRQSPSQGDTAEDSQISMPALPGYDDGAAGGSMDTESSGPRPERSAVSRAGSGPGMGGLGLGAAASPSIFTSEPIPGTTAQREYRTVTRWVLPSSKTAVRTLLRAAATTDTNDNGLGEVQFRIGGTAHVPWDRLAMYMSPYEYYEIRRNLVNFRINSITCQVTSLGTRAPYSTNTSNIEVANSNLQSPLIDYYNINHHFRTLPEENTLDILSKIRGSPVVKGNGQIISDTAWTTEFDNISSRMETRRWGKRLILCQRVPLILSGNNSVTLGDGYVHSYPNLMQHVHKMINASNHLGVSFEHTYDCNIDYYERQDMGGTVNGDTVHPELAGENGDIRAEKSPFVYDGSYSEIFTRRRGPFLGDYRLACISPMTNNDTVRTIPTFAFGHYLLRNIVNDLDTDTSSTAYNNVVDLNHEFILNMTLNATITINIPIYYNPSQAPDSYHMGTTERDAHFDGIIKCDYRETFNRNGKLSNSAPIDTSQGSYITNNAYQPSLIASTLKRKIETIVEEPRTMPSKNE